MCDIGLSLPAEEAAYSAECHRARKSLDAVKHHALRRISDIESLLCVKARRIGFEICGTVDYPGMENAEIWWPRIASEPNAAGWQNIPRKVVDGLPEEIEEWNKNDAKRNAATMNDNIAKNKTRIVFAVVEGDRPPTRIGYCYRFLGLFNVNGDESRKRGCCVWRRAGTTLDLPDFSKIGRLDKVNAPPLRAEGRGVHLVK